ncbi:programmed cell death protein 7 [Rhineura floridana]|uniref:programmed cell death protein 7 n=1 Tax=Rhineura floridana TaxID=261503 RepID=UPI002AC81481|nr:programmed cell death protein 7 [Rhineura floridana]
MSQQQQPFPSRFVKLPQPRCLPSTGAPPPGVFCGPPPPLPPQPFSPSAFSPFSAGARGLPSPAYPPPFRPPPPPLSPQWQQQQQPPPPERPSPQWRPEVTPPLVARERPRLPLGPDAAGPAGGLRRGGGGETDQWLSRFLARRHTGAAAPPPPCRGFSANQAGLLAAEALRLVSQVAALCGAWRRRDDHAEEEEVAVAEARLAELREAVWPLRSEASVAQLRRHAERSRQKRLLRRQRRQEARAAREAAAAREAEREALVEHWRAKRAQEAEDRHREQELKAAADSVLSEVLKKQADTKRMAEILRGLEKLRKLRKEAAGRKGVCPPLAADEAFENEVQSLRASIKIRTELYEAEERALRVMLEGEQEEERKREMEKKQKKEKEKLLQQKREMDSKLFGDSEEFPLTRLLKPFTQYYLQAEYSVPALIQIRHEWDRYLVPADHPEGNCIPPGWVLPYLPSSDIWATAVR